jgi:hypothetical protein
MQRRGTVQKPDGEIKKIKKLGFAGRAPDILKGKDERARAPVSTKSDTPHPYLADCLMDGPTEGHHEAEAVIPPLAVGRRIVKGIKRSGRVLEVASEG